MVIDWGNAFRWFGQILWFYRLMRVLKLFIAYVRVHMHRNLLKFRNFLRHLHHLHFLAINLRQTRLLIRIRLTRRIELLRVSLIKRLPLLSFKLRIFEHLFVVLVLVYIFHWDQTELHIRGYLFGNYLFLLILVIFLNGLTLTAAGRLNLCDPKIISIKVCA